MEYLGRLGLGNALTTFLGVLAVSILLIHRVACPAFLLGHDNFIVISITSESCGIVVALAIASIGLKLM